jgi:hypothetical protein
MRLLAVQVVVVADHLWGYYPVVQALLDKVTLVVLEALAPHILLEAVVAQARLGVMEVAALLAQEALALLLLFLVHLFITPVAAVVLVTLEMVTFPVLAVQVVAEVGVALVAERQELQTRVAAVVAVIRADQAW